MPPLGMKGNDKSIKPRGHKATMIDSGWLSHVHLWSKVRLIIEPISGKFAMYTKGINALYLEIYSAFDYSKLASTKTSKVRFTGLCQGDPPIIGPCPSQIDDNVQSVPMAWRHNHIQLYSEWIRSKLFMWSPLTLSMPGPEHDGQRFPENIIKLSCISLKQNHRNLFIEPIWLNSLTLKMSLSLNELSPSYLSICVPCDPLNETLVVLWQYV